MDMEPEESEDIKIIPEEWLKSPNSPIPNANPDNFIRPSSSNSSETIFDFKTFCFYCGKVCDLRRYRHSIKCVQKHFSIDKLIKAAKLRTDKQGAEVLDRLGGVTSLMKVGARYHSKCHNLFSRVLEPERAKSPTPAFRNVVFDRICEFIESSGKFEFTLAELQEQMKDDCLSTTILYKKLTDKYRDDIYIQHERGKPTIIRYKYFDFEKMCQRYYRGKDLLEPEKQTLYKIVAELLRNDVKKQTYDKESYPPGPDILKNVDTDIPESLSKFLRLLLENDNSEDVERLKMKRSTIAHAILSSIHGQSYISTLQLAVGSYVHKKTGSKPIINLLARMGVCVSYYHALQFETSIVLNPLEMELGDGVHVQHVFDSTDHNVSTLDGYETFHCLGGIAVYTPESDITYKGRIKRVTKLDAKTSLAVARQSSIQSIPYRFGGAKRLQTFEYHDLRKIKTFNLSASPRLPPAYSVYLWAKSFGIPKLPSWSGFMEVLTEDLLPLTSAVVCLPFINQPPSSPITINTALHYAQTKAREVKQNIAFVTFDEPLYMKARTIVAESRENGHLNDVVVRLGGFHCLMSYLGAVGYIMSGSGLDSLWSTVYASQSVKNMVNGHAYSRAMRAHILSFTALGIEICKTVESEKTNQYKTFISSFLEKWNADSPDIPTIGDCQADATVAEMTEEFITQIDSLKNNGPTSQLWLQYFQLIVIALQFVEAERLGNWQLHLQSIRKMLPVFHAAGHLSYAKSAQLYLEDMLALEDQQNSATRDEASGMSYRLFSEKGHFTVRRSDKKWAGIWTDMTIEQTLNRFFGTDLKHGRGVTSEVVARYLLSMPTMFSVMAAVEDYFNITTSSSEQHKDIGFSRQKRDEADLAKFLVWIDKHKPFQQRPHLVSLSTGIIGGPETNCHMAIEKGEVLMLTMVGKNAKDISLSIKKRVQTLESAKTNMHIGGASRIKTDSTQLFQRISVLFKDNVEQRQKAFHYELSPFPLALFDEKGYMRKTSKSELYKIFKIYKLPRDITLDTFLCNFTFIIDGGFLLHHVDWPHGQTYRDIFEVYRSHIVSHYRGNAWVIFDGNSDEFVGIKSYERYRRNEKGFAADVEIADDKFVSLTKTKLLSNIANTCQFVKLLAAYLTKHGINVKVAEEDADTLIVKTAKAVNELVDGPVAIISNDTDLLVLLIALSNERRHIYFNKVDMKETILYSTEDHAELREFILFAHAFLGCDTTSALNGKGKKKIINLLLKSGELRQRCQVFYKSECTVNELFEAAQDFIFHLYAIESGTPSLGIARYNKYEDSTMFSTLSRLSSLPPTADALTEHVKRVYLQIQTWLGNLLRPDDWGWERSSCVLFPVMTRQDPAPTELINLVSCDCKTDCTGTRCKCKKSGLPCSKYCEKCNGINCRNTHRVRLQSVANDEADDELDEFNINEDNFSEFLNTNALDEYNEDDE